ncbi:unnamed protein product, partial [Polarella glacialis]
QDWSAAFAVYAMSSSSLRPIPRQPAAFLANLTENMKRVHETRGMTTFQIYEGPQLKDGT